MFNTQPSSVFQSSITSTQPIEKLEKLRPHPQLHYGPVVKTNKFVNKLIDNPHLMMAPREKIAHANLL